MFEVWLNSTRLKHLIVTKDLEISRIVIKMGLKGGEKRREGGGERERERGKLATQKGSTFSNAKC